VEINPHQAGAWASVSHLYNQTGSGTKVALAAQRFSALPAATRHAWLLTHLADLRAGRITLEQLP